MNYKIKNRHRLKEKDIKKIIEKLKKTNTCKQQNVKSPYNVTEPSSPNTYK